MSTEFITIHFRWLEAYVAKGLITQGQLREIRIELESGRRFNPGSKYKQRRKEIERSRIEEVLSQCRGLRKQAADILNMSERSLYRKIKEYKLP